MIVDLCFCWQIHAYVNGVLKQSAAASGHITSGTVPLYIGADSFGDHFAGAVDEVALYSAAITPAQVLQHFHAGRTPSSGTAVVHGVTGSGVKRQEEVDTSRAVVILIHQSSRWRFPPA